MIHYADFEIGLHRHGAATYTVETRFHLPGGGSGCFESAEAPFDFARPLPDLPIRPTRIP